MCGRFSLRFRLNKLLEELAFLEAESFAYELDWQPRYNIAPTQNVLAVRSVGEQRQWCQLRWGLIPSWSKDVKIGASLINARAETVAEKPSFRTAFKRRRCLIPADGFYEWPKQSPARTKIPHFFTVGQTTSGEFSVGHDQLFTMAGLWETWRGDDGTTLETCSIITTTANECLAPLHDRMPVILALEQRSLWLDPLAEPTALQNLLQPYPAAAMHSRAVSSFVNNARHEGPDCLA